MKYKKGDIFILTRNINDGIIKIEEGTRGRVLNIANMLLTTVFYKIEWNKNIGGHDSDGLGKEGYCWNFDCSKIDNFSTISDIQLELEL